MADDRAYQYWLHNLPGIGDRTIERLLKRFGNAKAIYYADTELLGQVLKKDRAEGIKVFSAGWEIEQKYEEMCRMGIEIYSVENEKYPSRLRQLVNPPYALYCKGRMPEDECPSVAIIGARECSGYGSFVAAAFAGKMAMAGVSVISGMARGIDGISQRAVVESGGRTYAVLGNGADICYPASNRKLYQDILDGGGGVLSVFPPGTLPKKTHFPERNRIVAGLADALLVVEAREKSGTWITVDMALEQGKNVYAVPGRLTDRLSDGCNLLLRQGAGIALAPEDILAELALLAARQGKESIWGREGKKNVPSQKGAAGEEAGLLGVLDFYPQSADEILKEIKKTGQNVELPELLSELIDLCMEGRAAQVASNYFVKVR